jgi:hypothetical protein
VHESKTIDSSYRVINKEKTDLPNKAQIKILACLKTDLKDKPTIERTLKSIYESYRHEGGFTNFTEPSVIGVYLFTSEKVANEDKSNWIGMLVKRPGEENPEISINEWKADALIGESDGKKSADEVKLEKLKELLSKRNVELCALNKQISDLYLESIHKADRAFPDYGKKHDEYQDQVNNNDMSKLRKKYRLTKKNLEDVSNLAYLYCK